MIIGNGITPDRVEKEAERFERHLPEQHRVAGLAENHRRRASLRLVEEKRISTFAFDR